MTSFAALLGRGPKGLEPPRPIEFASLVQPRSPNTCLAAPLTHPGPKQITAPLLPVTADAGFEALLRVAEGFERTWILGSWPERRQAQWVERSPRANFPDIITAECVTTPAGTSLFLYSRSLFGYSDLGVNAKRVARWLAALAEALPTPAPALDPFALAVGDAAMGQHVLLAWDDPRGMPEIALAAATSGAASIQVMTPDRPDDADRLLAEAGLRLGLTNAAEAILATRPAAQDPLPPPLHAHPGAWRPWWMRGTLDAPDLRERLGEMDLAVDGADLARLDGDPPRRLAGLKASGARRLLLRSSVIPVTEALAAQGFTADTLWHAGQLDAGQSTALDAALRGMGVTLPQFTRIEGRLTREAAAAAGLSSPWWWFMGEAALARLLREAGWVIRGLRTQGPVVIVTATA